MKVPLNVGWLSEQDLLGLALELRGMRLCSAGREGVKVETLDQKVNAKLVLKWEDNLCFTLIEMNKLGFQVE